MTAPVQVRDPDQESVQALLEDVWASYVGGPLLPRPVTGEALVGRSVAIRGDWAGRVEVLTSRELAATVAAAMFRTSDVTDADVTDALGEITNIVGGGVKSLLGGECRLSLPGALVDAGAGAREVLRLELDAGGQPLVVVVLRDA